MIFHRFNCKVILSSHSFSIAYCLLNVVHVHVYSQNNNNLNNNLNNNNNNNNNYNYNYNYNYNNDNNYNNFILISQFVLFSMALVCLFWSG